MANFKSDLGKLLHHALRPFSKSDPDDADIPALPTLNPAASIPALFIDDLDLSSLARENRAITPLHVLCGKSYPSLDRWFADELLPELMAYATSAPDAEPLFFINVNLKLPPYGRRAARDGLKILEHIRFTSVLPEKIRFAPMVLYSFEPGWRISSLELNLLASQGSGAVFVQLPLNLQTLSAPEQWTRWKSEAGSLDSLRFLRMLNPAAALSGTDLYAHSFRNIAGGPKFCQEFAGDILGEDHEVFAQFKRETAEDLHLKRLFAVQPLLQPRQPPAAEARAAFAEACRNLNFLVIDDEHDEGWSLGLYSGITGSVLNAEEYVRICAAGEGTTSDGRMGVRARLDEQYFADDLAADFQSKLNEWSAAFQNQTAADVEFQNAAVEYKKAQNLLQKTEAQLSSARQILGLYRAPNPAQPNLWLHRLQACEWSIDFPSLKEAERAAAAASKALGEAKQALEGAKILLENAERILDGLAKERDKLMDEINQLWQPNSNKITEAFLDSTGGDEISESLFSQENALFFERMSSFIQRYQNIRQRGKDQSAVRDSLDRKHTAALESAERTEHEWETARQRCEESLLTSVESIAQSLALAKDCKAAAAQAHQDAGVNQNRAKIICADRDTLLRKCFRFNLVFLDLRIDPYRDSTRTVREATGMRVLDSIRDRIPMLPVIMMTASDRTESLREAYSKGADYWVKGIGTGDEMRAIVLRAAQRAALLPLWIEIQKVRARSYLKGWTYVRTGHSDNLGHFETIRILAAEKENREKIRCLLEDAFRTIWEYSGVSFLSASEKSHYFNPAITNLGIVQELRIRNMTDSLGNNRNWGDLQRLARLKRDPWSVKEWEFHDLRNSVSHSQAKVATRADAVQYLEYTVAELLRQ